LWSITHVLLFRPEDNLMLSASAPHHALGVHVVAEDKLVAPNGSTPKNPGMVWLASPSNVGDGNVIELWVALAYRHRQCQRAAPVDDDHSAGAAAFWEGPTVSQSGELIVLDVALVLALTWLASGRG
jgi:hypothetical protein